MFRRLGTLAAIVKSITANEFTHLLGETAHSTPHNYDAVRSAEAYEEINRCLILVIIAGYVGSHDEIKLWIKTVIK